MSVFLHRVQSVFVEQAYCLNLQINAWNLVSSEVLHIGYETKIQQIIYGERPRNIAGERN